LNIFCVLSTFGYEECGLADEYDFPILRSVNVLNV